MRNRNATSLVGQQTDAELSLIGCILIEETRIDDVINIIDSRDFANPSYAAIFRTACMLRQAGAPVNNLSVATALGDQQCAELAVVQTMLQAAEAVPHDAHTNYYAKRVREYATRRKLQVHLRNKVADLADCNKPLEPAEFNFEDHVTFRLNGSTGGLRMKTLGNVEPTETDWLWPGRIPIGSLTLYSGEPGIGKTFSAADFASRVAMGWEWPDGSLGCEPRDVVFLSAEDNEETLSKRFDSLGCDRNRIHIMDSGIEEFIDGKLQHRFLDLQRDLGHLEEYFEKVPHAGLLILDTVSDFMGNANQNSNGEVRAVYTPLARMAKRRNIAVLLLAHFNKNTGTTQAIYRGMGSLAFVAIARVSFGLFRDPEDKQRIIFAQVKNNLGKPQPALAFEIVEPGVTAWEPEPLDIDTDQLLAERKPKSMTQKDRAKNWLSDQLHDGPLAVETLKDRAEEFAVSWVTIERASKEMKVTKKPVGSNHNREWVWSLNGTTNP